MRSEDVVLDEVERGKRGLAVVLKKDKKVLIEKIKFVYYFEYFFS